MKRLVVTCLLLYATGLQQDSRAQGWLPLASAGSEVQVLGTQISNNTPLIAFPNNLTNAAWIKLNATTLANQTTAPDGTATASSITESSATGNHQVAQVSAQNTVLAGQYVATVYIKQALRTRAIIMFQNFGGANGIYYVIDLAGTQVAVAPATFGTGWGAALGPVIATASAVNIGDQLVGGGIATAAATAYVKCQFTVNVPSGFVLALDVQADAGSGTAAVNNNYAGNNTTPALFVWGATINPVQNIAEGDLTNWWSDRTSSAWVGIDLGLGNSASLTRYRFSPRPGDQSPQSSISYDYEYSMQGAQLQTSSDPTFATGVTTLDTIPATPYYPRFNLSERPISGPAGRYARILMPSGSYGGVSELQVFGLASTNAAAAPVAPVISPWGGAAPSGSKTVTITSATKQASIYYTTDGSSPTTGSTLYTGPFTLTVGASTVVKAIANWAALSTPASAAVSATFFNYDFAPKSDWYDNRGVLVDAFGGSVTWDANTSLYYWVGATANKYDPPWVQTPSQGNIIRSDVGVLMYSSPTAEPGSWKFVGNILPQPNSPTLTLCLRPHVLYNAANNNYVLWAHVGTASNIGTADRAAVATAPTMTGPWTWQTFTLNPDGVGFKDFSLFIDVDGVTAYVVYTIGTQNGIQISKLAADYQSTVATLALTATARESPQILVNPANGAYFLLTSQSNFYQSNTEMDVKYIVNTGASPLANSWGALPGASAFAVDPVGGNFNGQPSFTLVPQGKTQHMIGMDYWNTSFSGGSGFYTSRQVWLPITFPTATTLQISVPATWNLSTLNFLLKRDIDPAANDNSPLFLNQAA